MAAVIETIASQKSGGEKVNGDRPTIKLEVEEEKV